MTNNSKNDGREIVPVSTVAAAIEGDDVTHVIFILDRSGSMGGKEDDVIGGFNSYVENLRKDPEGCVGISYLRFDNVLELVWNDMPLADVQTMTRETYSVRGGTALLDAVGTSVSAVRDEPSHRYIVITNTDGQENASREWTGEKVKALIAEREARGNWTFAFFGEGLEAWAQAAQYGYARGSAAAYSASDTRAMYGSKARVSKLMHMRRMRSSKSFAAATHAAMDNPALSDDDLAKILEEDGDAAVTPDAPSGN